MANRAALGMAAEKFMAAIAIDEIIVARTGLVTSHAAARTAPKDNIAPAGPASGSRRRKSFAAGLRSTVERDLGDGWLIVVLMTPVDAAAHAPSPAVNIASTCNLGGSGADDATDRSLRVFPERFRENPRWHMTHRRMKMAL
jgi:hypothetical protein